MTRAPLPTSPVALHTAFRQLQASDSYSSQQVFERTALRRMLLGIGLLQPLQVDQFPVNRRKLGRLGQTDQSEIRRGAVERKQESSDPVCQSRPYVCTQTPTRLDERGPGRRHPVMPARSSSYQSARCCPSYGISFVSHYYRKIYDLSPYCYPLINPLFRNGNPVDRSGGSRTSSSLTTLSASNRSAKP